MARPKHGALSGVPCPCVRRTLKRPPMSDHYHCHDRDDTKVAASRQRSLVRTKKLKRAA
jgi:hypothetical protein